MKVQFLVADLNLVGGGERVALNLAAGFSKYLGYETEVVSIQKLTSAPPFSTAPEVRIRSVDLDLHSMSIVSKVYSRACAFLRAPAILAESKPDIVLGIGTFPNLVLSFLGKSSAKKVGCEHSWFGAPTFYWKILRRLLYKKLDSVVVLTHAAKTDARGLNSRILVIPNSSPFNSPQKANLHSKKILAIGRFEYQKGFDRLIEAFSRIANKCPDWSLNLFGEGSNWVNLKKQIQALGLSDQITINRPTLDIAEEYRKASFLVLTSRHEGLPMVLIEALCFGLPAVAFDCPNGPRDIIKDGETGYLVREGDINAFSVRMMDLISNSETLERMSESSIRHAENFSTKHICKTWKDHFDDLVGSD
ncbi:glycosyltransferase family 4 protein [Gammaproteobacteria bacterium]|nr:glycosyltransferase family 4 protein [Gammaproteobacteria bacterium]